MAEYLIQDTTLDAIADAINAKTGGSSAMTPAQMVTEIGSISGGGGGLSNYFTAVNCVTIRNDATYSYSNGFVIPDAKWNSVRKIEIRFKLANPDAAHFIWATAGRTAGTQPFFDKVVLSGSGASSGTVITNEVVNGITHYVLTLIGTKNEPFRIGSWNNVTYSQTAAYYELKMWDANDNLLVDLQPSINSVSGIASFLNKVSGIFYESTESFIAGEVLS